MRICLMFIGTPRLLEATDAHGVIGRFAKKLIISFLDDTESDPVRSYRDGE